MVTTQGMRWGENGRSPTSLSLLGPEPEAEAEPEQEKPKIASFLMQREPGSPRVESATFHGRPATKHHKLLLGRPIGNGRG